MEVEHVAVAFAYSSGLARVVGDLDGVERDGLGAWDVLVRRHADAHDEGHGVWPLGCAVLRSDWYDGGSMRPKLRTARAGESTENSGGS